MPDIAALSEAAISSQAYLLSESSAGKWTASVFCDLLALIAAWTEHSGRAGTDIVHIGCYRPALPLVRDIVSHNGARVLLTEAAKNALPAGFETSSIAVGEVDGLPIFVGLQGWGRALSSSLTRQRNVVSVQKFGPEGWVRRYLAAHRGDAQEFAEAGIYNESTYLSREATLLARLRHKVGLARLGYVVQTNTRDPCEIVKGAPPWLLVKPIRELRVTERVAKALHASNVSAVQDLLSYDLARLLRIPKFGRNSSLDLTGGLSKALADGPAIIAAQDGMRSGFSLDRCLAMLSAKERDILCRRMGHGRGRQTLQQIADEYNVTRERVRQIEASGARKLSCFVSMCGRLPQQ